MFFDGAAYDRFMGRWSLSLAPQLIEFALVGEGQAVLDVGSGTGALTFAAAAVPGVRAIGVDTAQQYLRFAQEHVRGDTIGFEVADAQALPFPDDTFDRALSLLTLNFVPAPERALTEMTRVTRPGGLVAAAVWEYGAGMEMLRTFWDEAVALDPSAPDERHMPLSRAGELEALWQASRLGNVEETRLVIETTFTSFDDYWQGFLGGQGPAGVYTAALAASRRSALRSRLQDRLAPSNGGFALLAAARAVRGVVRT